MSKNWAITIGINQYDNLQNLQFAKRDAEEMRSFFIQDLKINPTEIYHFTDDSDPIPADGGEIKSRPTFAGLRRFLRIRFEQRFLDPQDNLWFFFAGHGVQFEDRDYLMPLDGDPGDIENTAIPLHYVTERLRRCGAENVILLVDACRSRSRSGLGVGNELQQGVVTFYACSPREQSYEIEDPSIQHGSFTYALLQGLKLQGASENCATVERLNHHLVRRVPQLNQQYDKPRQTPYSKIEPIHKEHLILLPRLATVNDLNLLKMDAYRAETNQNVHEAVQLWRRVLAKDGTDNDAFEAIQRLALRPNPVPSIQPKPETQVSLSGRQIVTPVSSPVSSSDNKDLTQGNFSEDLGNDVAINMIYVPPGEFLMGSPENELERLDTESPQHQVSVASCWMGKYPVTQAQWRRVALLPKANIELDPNPSRFDGENLPVERVSWHESVEFCQRLSQKTGKEYRLPTESEWEYACRAGTTTPFYFGETINTDQANYDGNYTYAGGKKGQYRATTSPIGTFPANAFDMCDMHGNVWEWCLDHWHQNYKGAPRDGTAWLNENDSRLLRGGSWDDNPRYCRSAVRDYLERGYQNDNVGFRVVCVSARAF